MVYRPPKSKSAGPRFPQNSPEADPLEGPLTPSSSSRPGDIRAGDDRNLVTVSDYAGADLEDRAWLFWNRNQKSVIWAVIIACAAILAWQGSKIYKDYVFKETQAAYAKADTPAALIEFAKSHSGTDLAKVAQIQAADAYYKAGQSNEAITAYDDAVSLWGSDATGQRARLGRAMARLQKGDSATAKTELEDLYSQTDNSDNYRAQAAYFLAMLAVQAGDGATAGKWIDRAKSFPQAEPWPSQASELADLAPIISGVTVTASRGPTNAGVSVDMAPGVVGQTPAPPAPSANVVAPAARPNAPMTTPPPASTPPAETSGAGSPPAATPPTAAPGSMNLPPIDSLSQ